MKDYKEATKKLDFAQQITENELNKQCELTFNHAMDGLITKDYAIANLTSLQVRAPTVEWKDKIATMMNTIANRGRKEAEAMAKGMKELGYSDTDIQDMERSLTK